MCVHVCAGDLSIAESDAGGEIGRGDGDEEQVDGADGVAVENLTSEGYISDEEEVDAADGVAVENLRCVWRWWWCSIAMLVLILQ